MVLYKYNPQNAPFDELKKTFTARKELLSMILDEIKKHKRSKSNQHYLIIGPRGIGKTNLLQMIYHNVKEDIKLSKSFIPLQFAEEEYSIGSLREIFEKIIEVLIEETFSSEAEEFLEQLQSEDNDKIADDRAIEFLKNQSKIEKKKFIVFVDNLDLILDEQLKDKMETFQNTISPYTIFSRLLILTI
jgi:Cdc6-like AAA superfamily ATPase